MQTKLIDAVLKSKFKNIKLTDKQRFKKWATQLLSFNLSNAFIHQAPNDLAAMLEFFWLGCSKRLSSAIYVAAYQAEPNASGAQAHTTLLINVKDTPFVVDTVRLVLSRQDHDLYGFINAADMPVRRHTKGDIKSVGPTKIDEASTEAFLIVEINRITDQKDIELLLEQIRFALQDVQYAVSDWQRMQARMSVAILNLTALSQPGVLKHRDEAIDFMKWLLKFFTFIGYREYTVDGRKKMLQFDTESPLGVLRSNHFNHDEVDSHSPRTIFDPDSIEKFVVVGKSKNRSTMHRPPYTDVIVVRLHNDQGQFFGEMRFVGLFTSNAYESDPMVAPFLRNKTQRIVSALNVPQAVGYTRKRLGHILRTFPRDELFQADVADLIPMIRGVLALQDSRATRVFIRHDKFKRFVSCVLYLPEANHTHDLTEQLRKYLKDVYQAKDITISTQSTDHEHVCLYFVMRVDANMQPTKADDLVTSKIAEMCRSWHDRLHDASIDVFGEEKGVCLFKKVRHRFPAQYRETFGAHDALKDLSHVDQLNEHDALRLGAIWYADQKIFKIRAYQYTPTLSLSDVLPILENLGLHLKNEIGAGIWSAGHNHRCWVSEFNTSPAHPIAQFDAGVTQQILDSFHHIYQGETANDSFNGLTPVAGMPWQKVRIIRALYHYLKQIGSMLSEQFVATTLMHYGQITTTLMACFDARFNPEIPTEQRQKMYAARRRQLVQLFEQINTVDEDKVFRSLLNLIEAIVRTNAYLKDDAGQTLPFVSFKIQSTHVKDIPQPAPMFETFTFSHQFSGVHLRADKVARGGLRWSDREDFRKEILDLMKAQQVKNALIVPNGAKGGFLIKKNMSGWTREAIHQKGIECYQMFIKSLLMLTDNIVDGELVKPKQVVCHDGDDSYLVVAADKGTASFSDVANAIALDYQFWLKDAFASGGSNGYDHKKMGITAKGAWEAVKWHFQEFGHDVASQPFTVIGIGGMAGDVFGNGMLLSDQIRLVAAFNHQFIFLDPTPKPAISHSERKRLFELPNSMWSDYDPKLISKGGGVFSRQEKEIPISKPVAKALGLVGQTKMSPAVLIQAILAAPVDLIWNGGIGTYVKSSNQSHHDVGDHGNDRLRIDATDLRCKVFAEGGNLGITQLGRIEAELCGVKINTDFIDNSAGVDCSDHEVNIKIFLNGLMAKQKMSAKTRDQWLADMSDEVSKLVLKNNRNQNMALSLAAAVLPEHLYLYERFMDWAVSQDYLNKEIEFLPSPKHLKERAALGKTLTRPELSILLTYSKIILQKQIIQTGFCKHDGVAHYAWKSLPACLRVKFESAMVDHPLRHEMIATQLSGEFIQTLGLTFIPEIKDEVDITIEEIMMAYLFIKKFYDLDALYAALDEAEAFVSHEIMLRTRVRLRIILRRSTRWLLRHQTLLSGDPQILSEFIQKRAQLVPILPDVVQGNQKVDYERMMLQLSDTDLAVDTSKMIAQIFLMHAALCIIDTSIMCRGDIHQLAELHALCGDALRFEQLRSSLNYNNFASRWSVISRFKLKGMIDALQSEIVVILFNAMVQQSKPVCEQGILEQLQQKAPKAYQNWQSASIILQPDANLEFEVLFVLVAELEKFKYKLMDELTPKS